MLKDSYKTDEEYQQLISALTFGTSGPDGFSLQNDILLYKEMVFLSAASPLKSLILHHVHDSPLRGHSSYLKTLYRVKQDFFWWGMKKDVKDHIRDCEICQRIKVETSKPGGLLQPLPIPYRPCTDISMDFMDSLPKSHGYEVILVVVDRLTKYVHFVALSHPYTAARVSVVFMRDIFKLHCMPQSIVCDRDAVFTSKFWAELLKLQGTDLAMSLAYHPQTDGQSKVVNRSLEQYLRAFAHDKPNTWFDRLHLVEFWFNTNYHTSIKLTPYEVLYGFPLPKILDYILGTTSVYALDKFLHSRS